MTFLGLYRSLLSLKMFKNYVYDCAGIKTSVKYNPGWIDYYMFIIIMSFLSSDLKRNCN